MHRHTHIASEPMSGFVTTSDGKSAVMAKMIYKPTDPYAVTTTITDPSGVVQIWRVGRDLMLTGLTAPQAEPAGLDRLRVWSRERDAGGHSLLIGMMASFLGVLELDLAEVVAFLATTLDALPRGQENLHLDFDAELDELVSQ
jgi:Streptomyces sporulation and cell division protein, SsgA